MERSRAPRRTSRGSVRLGSLVALVVAVVTGCSSDGTPPRNAPPSASLPASPATQSSASRAPAPQEPGPEPSPAISRLGKTKIVTVGDVEIRATRGESGILVACSLTNSADRTRSIKVKVSVGDGREWVATNEFDFPRVPAGGVASQSTVMGASRPGELPDDPKVYVDAVLPY